MKSEDKYTSTFENSAAALDAKSRKAHTISNIMEIAKQSEEEENKGRS